MEDERIERVGEREMNPPRSYPNVEIYAEASGMEFKFRELVCEVRFGPRLEMSWPHCHPETLVDALNLGLGIRCTGLRVVEPGA